MLKRPPKRRRRTHPSLEAVIWSADCLLRFPCILLKTNRNPGMLGFRIRGRVWRVSSEKDQLSRPTPISAVFVWYHVTRIIPEAIRIAGPCRKSGKEYDYLFRMLLIGDSGMAENGGGFRAAACGELRQGPLLTERVFS